MSATVGEFEAFVAARYDRLVRAARLVAPDPSQAEDLVQSALIRTLSHWDGLTDPRAAEAYTHKTLVRLAIRAGRRRWRGERPTAALPEAIAIDQYAQRDDADAVRRALAAIPEQQRVVIVLRYYLQLSEAETADVLGCAIGTVKSRSNRALVALRDGGWLSSPTKITEAADE